MRCAWSYRELVNAIHVKIPPWTHCFILCCVSIFFVVGLSACQQEDDMHDLSGVVMLELRETCVDQERHVALYAETREQYPCLNFFIEYAVIQGSSQTNVYFKGLQVPKICLTALGPAMAIVETGLMNPGQHPVNFHLNEEDLNTLFHLSEDLLQVELLSDNVEFLEFTELEMHRLSDYHYWGYIQVLRSDSDKNAADFYEDLWDAGAQPVSLEPGNYGFFRIKEEEETILFDGTYHRKVQNPLLFQFDGDVDVIRDLANDYSENLAISFSNPLGEHHDNQQ